MHAKIALEYAYFSQITLGIVILLVMWQRKLLRQFSILAVYLSVQTLHVLASTSLLYFRKELHLSKVQAYDLYFWSYWACYAAEAILLLLVIHNVFSIAMKPLEGLHQLGKIIFRWIVAVSLALSVCIVSSSMVSFGRHSIDEACAIIASQVQQGVCVLTLCLLLFVCFAARPLGLTPRSHIFGVSLGLGFVAASNLVNAAWYTSTNTTHNLYSPAYLIWAGGAIVALVIWGVYFVLPEPERRMILLPTTSPFFFWNKVSEALGDDPGQVAIAGFTPDMLAEGELSMLTAMSKAAREREEAAENEAQFHEHHAMAQ